MQLHSSLGKSDHVIVTFTVCIDLPRTIHKGRYKGTLRDRPLDLSMNTVETGSESLWRLTGESPIVLHDEFAPTKGHEN